MKKVILHLGAHKTATTYIQHNLVKLKNENPDAFSYIPLNELRAGVTQFINKRAYAGKPLRKKFINFIRNPKAFVQEKFIIKAFIEQHSDTDRLIISDENILGNPTELKNGLLYANLKRRANALISLFPENTEFKVIFSIREYSRFITSMYVEYLRHHPFCSFEEYSKEINYENLRWTNVYKSLEEIFGHENVHLYNFESFDADELITLITGNDLHLSCSNIKRKASILRSTPPPKIIKLLDFINDNFDAQLAKFIFSKLESSGKIHKYTEEEKYNPAAELSIANCFISDLNILQEQSAVYNYISLK